MPETLAESRSKSSESQFELTLGNKELIGVLTIVFVLLGVFFGMGYVLGRGSAPIETAAAEPYVATGARSAMGERAAPPSEPQTGQAVIIDATAAAKAETSPTPAPVASPTPANSSAYLAQPQPGETYIQVIATARPEAELVTEMLLKRGFRATVAEGPDKFFRVLVGPSTDTADLAKWKADLSAAGFSKAFVKKY